MGKLRTMLASTVVTATALTGLVAVAGPAAATAPVNNAFASAEVLGAKGSIIRSNVSATGQLNEPAPITGQASASIWFKWTPTTTHRVTVDTVGSDIDTVLAVYDTGGLSASLLNLNEIASDDDGFGCDTSSLVQFDAVAGTAYWIQVDTWDPLDTSPNLVLNWNNPRGNPPANDDIANAVAINGLNPSTITSTNAEATAESAIFEDPSTNSVWYSFTATADGVLSTSITSTLVDNVFGLSSFHSAGVFTGPDVDNMVPQGWVYTDDPALDVSLLTGTKVWIQVSSLPCEQGQFTLTLSGIQSSVTTLYSDAEYNQLVGIAAKIGMSPEQLQHDSVGIIEFIYGIAGVKGPIAIAPPASGTNPVTSNWAPTDAPVLNSLQTKWAGLTKPETQKYATGIVMFLLSLS